MNTGTALETPKSDAALENYGAFCDAIRDRLENGRRVYGDSSFDRSLPRLLTEIQEELMDVCGWSFILLERIEALRKQIALVDPK